MPQMPQEKKLSNSLKRACGIPASVIDQPFLQRTFTNLLHSDLTSLAVRVSESD
jgi:hypothetical protein